MAAPAKVRLLETIVDVNDKPMPTEGETVTCQYVAMARNSRRHLYPSYDDDAIRNPKEGVILDSGRSCTWTVGTGEVIKGLDAAVLKMNEGEHMVWEIPPALGYGSSGVPGV
jgi:FKBP-type peptidyl-prolyl cis-trans isomerase 2